MLDLPRYLLGVAEICLLVGFAWLGATQVRRWLLPDFSGAPAHLATSVLALALLLWAAELLGTVGLFEPLPYIVSVVLASLAAGALSSGLTEAGAQGGGASPAGGAVGGPTPEEALATGGGGGSPAVTGPAGLSASTLIALAIAAVAGVNFATEAKGKLGTGMTGFDSTWDHGAVAAGVFPSGHTWDLHFMAPQFLAWFYPANAEIFHGVGMLAFDRDVLSPLLNLGWFVGCLVACWCIGRPYGVAPWSLALGAIALSVPALADQAGEARNDIVGIFFLLTAVAIALNAQRGRNALIVVGLAAGLAAGTKLNFLLPAAVLVIGLAAIAPAGARWRALVATGLAALAGGGYWYLRNLIHTGNPLPWIDSIGPISLPAPDQVLGGREDHSVLDYLNSGSVWSDWLLPGLHDGIGLLLPPLAGVGRRCSCRPAALPREAGQPIAAGGRARRAGCRTCMADRPDLGLRPRRHAPRLRGRAPLSGSRSRTGLGSAPGGAACAAPGDRRGGPLERADTQSAEPIGEALVRARGSPRRPRSALPSSSGGHRLPGPAPLPAKPLCGAGLQRARLERRIRLGSRPERRSHRDYQHTSIPAVRHRPEQQRHLHPR